MFIAEIITSIIIEQTPFDPSNRSGGPSVHILGIMGAKRTSSIIHGEVFRLITPIFLHAGILHIGGNLVTQSLFGFSIEKYWRWKKMALIYFVSGLYTYCLFFFIFFLF